ncbi:NAD(P)/FAD-dependent oxidoreductase [Salinactinospora qingdaonensis]|uniref:NAD(P)/FAD-dependent oxidoreductase n=1 Tax=Salinactinospora qingdaonensis TaxID=702744 RepID=A0ABP7FE08_9ACTN
MIGAGIGGLTAAAGLARAGYEVEVYERASGLRPAGTALSLMSNALTALDTIGIKPDFEGRAVVFDSLRFLTRTGRPIRTMHFGEIAAEVGQPNLAIHRADLQQALLEQADGCKVEVGATATGFTRVGDEVRVDFQDGRQVYGDVVIGADGFNSAIRRGLVGAEQPNDAGYICWRATPQFRHPKVTDGYAAHYWGRGQRFGLVDIGGGYVYWWATKNMPAAQARVWQGGKEAIARLFAGWAPEVRQTIEATPAETIHSVPEEDRPFLERWGEGPVTLLGDAAHPMVSSLGQGAAIAIEDGVVLAQCLASTDDVAGGLRAYEDHRRERARAIVEASRGLSRIEQLQHPLWTLGRRLYFQFAPERTFREQNQAALTFQGVPA